MRTKTAQQGFSLIELLVYISILSVVVGVIAAYLLWVIQSQGKTKAIQDTIAEAERAMSIITSEVREAKSVYTPTSVLDSTPGQLSLETTKYLPSGETITYVDFYLCNTDRLCWKKESQPPVSVTSDEVRVSSLTFQEIATGSGKSSVKITLTVEHDVSADSPYQNSITLTSTASLR